MRNRKRSVSPLHDWGLDPFRTMQRFAEQMNRIVGEVAAATPLRAELLITEDDDEDDDDIPDMHVERSGDQLMITADLPGVRREDMSIEVNGDRVTLTIAAPVRRGPRH